MLAARENGTLPLPANFTMLRLHPNDPWLPHDIFIRWRMTAPQRLQQLASLS
jgi:hypothetical protein